MRLQAPWHATDCTTPVEPLAIPIVGAKRYWSVRDVCTFTALHNSLMYGSHACDILLPFTIQPAAPFQAPPVTGPQADPRRVPRAGGPPKAFGGILSTHQKFVVTPPGGTPTSLPA